MKTLQNYTNGEFSSPSGAESVEYTNPATGEVLGTFPDTPENVVAETTAAARAAQPGWAALPAVQRAGYLHQLASLLRDHVEPLARVITAEQGKVLPLARVEVSFTADYLDYMGQWARRIEGEIIESDRPGENIFLFRKPLGVVGGILPWNFPFFLIARKLAPALVCGNTIVIKPSEETPENAFEFFELLDQIDLPNGVANLVNGLGASTGKALSSSPDIDMVSFTGSVETGSKIMAAAAQHITKVNLELGGKAPAIVFHDADLDLAVKAITSSRVINSGQVCNCAERVYVDARVADAFSEKLVKAMAATRCGNPLEDETLDYGPMINEAGFNKVDAMVSKAKGDGAEILTGGSRIGDGPGFYYAPTVLGNCRQEMEVAHKEIFGPVIPVTPFEDFDQAMAYANDCEFGLTSSIYTRDLNRALTACKQIQFGETYVNRENFEAMQGFHAGWRKSGIGGADGKHGLYEYTQTQVVYMQAGELG